MIVSVLHRESYAPSPWHSAARYASGKFVCSHRQQRSSRSPYASQKRRQCMPRKARAVRFAAPGGPEVMKLETIDLADPGPGEVLVRQTAVGVNYQDTYHRSGFYPLPMPSGIGTEAAGVIETVGSGVASFRPGDRVVYCGGAPGAYADFRVVSADRLLKTPEGITDEHAAAVLLKG